MISAYAPQAGLDEEDKKRFLEDLDKVAWGIPHTEKLFVEEISMATLGLFQGAMTRFMVVLVLGLETKEEFCF